MARNFTRALQDGFLDETLDLENPVSFILGSGLGRNHQ